jgi:penicillin-binding protein 1A
MGVFIGYDNPQPMGHGETGGELAAPIFADFFKMVLKDKPAVPFRTPPDILQVRINRRTGQRTDPNDPDAITEYFKPGTEPSDGYATAADYSGQERPRGFSPWGAPNPSPWGAPPQQPPPSEGGYPPPPYGREPRAGGLY